MTKVLHVYKTYYPDTFGGVEHVISTLAKNAKNHHIDTEIFCLTSGQTRTDFFDGIKVHYVHAPVTIASMPLSWGAFSSFKSLAKNFDTIHYHFPFPLMDLWHFYANAKAKFVLTYHSDIIKQKTTAFFYRPIMDCFLKKMDAIVTTSPPYLSTSKTLQKHKEKVHIIPIGIDAEDYPKPCNTNVQLYRQKFGDIFFVFVGVLRYYKGIHTLIEAVRYLPHIKIVIAGKGPVEGELQQQAKDLENVFFMGAVTEQEKIDLLHASSGFVFPSHLRSEAFGISLLEGAMCEKPLISCEIGTGTTYINLDHETGLAVPPNDAAALGHALSKLYDDKELREKYGVNAKLRYRDLFLKEKMVTDYVRIYQS